MYKALLDLSSEEDESDMEDELLLLLEKGKRECWVTDFLKDRNRFSEFRLYFDLPDCKFQNYFRVTRAQFTELVNLVEEKVKRRDTSFRKAIPVEMKLAVCLRFLATGPSYKDLAYSYRLGERTVAQIVEEMTEALWQSLMPLVLPPPDKDVWRKIAVDFGSRWQFPNCIGAIDGKHVTIKAPPHSGSAFFNYKKTYSIVLLAVADANSQFVVIDVGSSGRFSDGGIFSSSALGQHLRNGSLNIPEDCPLSAGAVEMPHVFVADEAFPLQKHLMRPFPRDQLTTESRIFNYRLSRARRIVENAFGILAVRWRVYRRPFECKLETVDRIVKATCVLHNFLGKNSGHSSITATEIEDAQAERDGQLLDLGRTGGCSSREAFAIRELYKNYFNFVGAVPWQKSRVAKKLGFD